MWGWVLHSEQALGQLLQPDQVRILVLLMWEALLQLLLKLLGPEMMLGWPDWAQAWALASLGRCQEAGWGWG